MSYKGPQRLTSWKEIAAHLGRDVRTVMRWEKDRGLPLHRVGASRRVLFAYTDELDAWSHGGNATDAGGQESEADAGTAADPSRTRHPPSRWLAAATSLVMLVAVGWWVALSRASEGPLTVRVTEAAIVATDVSGTERWRYAFPEGSKASPLVRRMDLGADRVLASVPGTFAAYAQLIRPADTAIEGGRLFWLSPAGMLRRTFTFEDRLAFTSGTYGPPWALTDFRVDEAGGARRIAVAAHHYEWWPSVVTVLDERWSRRGTFVNAGWVERLRWLGRDRLLIAGFSNAKDGGMIALLDTNSLDGQSPAPAGSQFVCTACGSGVPLRYVVLPRSEVNRASGSRFNRVVLEVKPEGMVARTVEVAVETGSAVDALYEFTPALDLVRASYSDKYWEMHAQLEAQGKITHTRDHCPDRNGPREYQMWEPATGWRTAPIAPPHGPSSQARTRR